LELILIIQIINKNKIIIESCIPDFYEKLLELKQINFENPNKNSIKISINVIFNKLNKLKKLLRIRNNTHTRKVTINRAVLNKKHGTYTINGEEYIIPKSSIGISRKYNTLISDLDGENPIHTLQNIQAIVQEELNKKKRLHSSKYYNDKQQLLNKINNLINELINKLSP